jgi:hypothetical protein
MRDDIPVALWEFVVFLVVAIIAVAAAIYSAI